MTTAAIHPNVIAGETPTLSPYAPASRSDLDKQHELGQFLSVSNTSCVTILQSMSPSVKACATAIAAGRNCAFMPA
jgi:hypothetical protein